MTSLERAAAGMMAATGGTAAAVPALKETPCST